MFTYLGAQFVLPTDVLRIHPAQLNRWLEEVWAAGPANLPLPGGGAPFLGQAGLLPALAYPVPAGGAGAMPGGSGIVGNPPANNTGGPFAFPAGNLPIWNHLIYGYLLENTGMFEIFSEVARLALTSEQLSAQFTNEAVQWLRSTEDLFFRDQSGFSVAATVSQLRPDARVTRRNAYWRMFGWDLAHQLPRSTPVDGTQPWKRDVGAGANTTFREKWNELLRQIWLARENAQNVAGANPTDDSYLVLLCDSLRDMMRMRRRGGMLAREEFAAGVTMNWFDLTVSADTPIVTALGAQAASPADRLALIAQRVGMTAAPRARELFQLAEPVSLVLRLIEADAFANNAAVQLFYIGNGFLATQMTEIIDLWQSATGESLKGRSVIARQDTLRADQPQQPLRAPGSQPLFTSPPVPALNGARP